MMLFVTTASYVDFSSNVHKWSIVLQQLHNVPMSNSTEHNIVLQQYVPMSNSTEHNRTITLYASSNIQYIVGGNWKLFLVLFLHETKCVEWGLRIPRLVHFKGPLFFKII